MSADEKVLTAAHIVHAADRVAVEFTEGSAVNLPYLLAILKSLLANT